MWPASRRERSSSSVASLDRRCTWSRIVARNSSRVASSMSSSSISSRNPPSEKSGVRSSCDALAMNSLRARSSRARRRRMWSKARASWPISSWPWSTIGSSNVPPAMRSAARSSRRIRPREQPGGEVPDDEHEREHDAARDQQPLPRDADRAEGVGERRGQERDVAVREQERDLGIARAVAARPCPHRLVAREGGLDRDRVVVDVGRRARARASPAARRGTDGCGVEDRVDDDPGADVVGRVGGELPRVRRRSGRRWRAAGGRTRGAGSILLSISRLSSDGMTTR